MVKVIDDKRDEIHDYEKKREGEIERGKREDVQHARDARYVAIDITGSGEFNQLVKRDDEGDEKP